MRDGEGGTILPSGRPEGSIEDPGGEVVWAVPPDDGLSVWVRADPRSGTRTDSDGGDGMGFRPGSRGGFDGAGASFDAAVISPPPGVAGRTHKIAATARTAKTVVPMERNQSRLTRAGADADRREETPG
jgi:hypothetical protein